MMEILKLIGLYIGAFIALGYYIALLIIMLITVVYGVGYVYDSIFGNSLVLAVKRGLFSLFVRRLLYLEYTYLSCSYI